MELFVIFAIVFYAFLAIAPEGLLQACLAMVWLLMIVSGIAGIIIAL